MRRVSLLSSLALIAFGCGDSHTSRLRDGGPEDDGAVVLRDGGTPDEDAARPLDAGRPVDAGRPDDGGPPDSGPPDSGPPPETCDAPGAVETVSCGMCGSVERFCTAAGVWAYGVCEGEGECAAGTTGSIACGNCGVQATRCTASCTWEPTGACTAEGECAPGAMMTTSDGCPSGQTREVTCDDTCAFVETMACRADACPTPGAIETVPCGMCGSRERFCNSTRTWEYGACMGEGVCVPGTTGTTSCGRCGSQPARCTTSCTWSPTDVCTGEGPCTPGTTTRTSDGCPAGQTRLASCNASCSYVTVEACRADVPVDVLLLLDVTGSHASRVASQRATFIDRLIRPLIALGDVAVGIAYYADFPVGSYGSTGDLPFEGGIEPTRTSSAVEAELATSPSRYGGDLPESGIEALSVLTGGAVPPTGVAMACSSGRVSGGCWRSGAVRIVILYTDATQHNGPMPAGAGLYDPYAGITPAPATWTGTTGVLSRMTAQGVELIALIHDPGSSSPDVRPQHARMISDLGQPAANMIDATSTLLPTALDAAVARVRAIGGY